MRASTRSSGSSVSRKRRPRPRLSSLGRCVSATRQVSTARVAASASACGPASDERVVDAGQRGQPDGEPLGRQQIGGHGRVVGRRRRRRGKAGEALDVVPDHVRGQPPQAVPRLAAHDGRRHRRPAVVDGDGVSPSAPSPAGAQPRAASLCSSSAARVPSVSSGTSRGMGSSATAAGPAATAPSSARRPPGGGELAHPAHQAGELPAGEDGLHLGGRQRVPTGRQLFHVHVQRHVQDHGRQPLARAGRSPRSHAAARAASPSRSRPAARRSHPASRTAAAAAAAVFSPMPGTPGMLSEVSPLRPM